ncbi:MAG: hypothetical protein PHC97_03570 [Patescibacteria group bacterium]|nr:hypothetical protein [Patescibacteria group bacterium]
MKKVIVFLALAMLVSFQAQAVEDNPQMGVSLNVSRNLENNFSLLGNMCFINLMSGYSPYTSLGLGYKFSDQFSIDGFAGYGFETDEQDRGWFAGADSVFKSGKWVLVDSFYYYAGFDALFIYGSLSYPIGFMRVGLDSRNYHYLSVEDEGSRSYQIGPSLTIPFNDKLSLKLNYYYAFEPYGELPEDSNVYKATLNFNF